MEIFFLFSLFINYHRWCWYFGLTVLAYQVEAKVEPPKNTGAAEGSSSKQEDIGEKEEETEKEETAAAPARRRRRDN